MLWPDFWISIKITIGTAIFSIVLGRILSISNKEDEK